MELLREHFWAVLLIAILLMTLLIASIFLIVYICIHKRVSKYNTKSTANEKNALSFEQRCDHQDDQPYVADEKPPLFSRSQLVISNSVNQSSVNLSSASDYLKIEDPAPSLIEIYSKVQKMTGEKESDIIYEDVEIAVSDDNDDYDDIG